MAATYCDLETGLCVAPAEAPDPGPVVELLVVTDPACSACWAMEPAWRALLFRYGDRVRVRHVLGGLLPSWDEFGGDPGAAIYGPADVAPHWDHIAATTGQPIDSSVWRTDPIHSTYPACQATVAARLLDPAKETRYLRRLREAVFIEARNIARPEVLLDAAEEVGLDGAAIEQMLRDGTAAREFGADLDFARALKAPAMPTVVVRAGDQQLRLVATQPYRRLEQVLLAVTDWEPSTSIPTLDEALTMYGRGTTREFAELLRIDPATARDQLDEAGAVACPVGRDFAWSRR
jgi:predicted DsbA family dithiol-disulfide isomerase